MYRTKTLYLKQLVNIDNWSLQKLSEIFSLQFDKEMGFGFIDTQTIDANIEATLIYQSVITQQVFDPHEQKLLADKKIVFYEAPFQLDYERGVLNSYVGGQKKKKVLSVINQLFNYKIIIDDISINIEKTLSRLKKLNKYNILKMTINNFKPQKGIIGKFNASVEDQELAHHLIEIYNSDINDVTLNFFCDNGEVIWRLSALGKISIRTKEKLLSEQVDFAKKFIL